jgi:hypothetical protein
MKRDYTTGESDTVIFFYGKEVEQTPAYNMDTLFVVGIQTVDSIEEKLAATASNIKHIFFGANQSFKPGLDFPKDASEWDIWENMITHFLKKDVWCSLDIPVSHAEAFLETGLVGYNTFIPQLSVPVPYVKLWNYNTMLKIDDKDFKATNPGVWCHSLHSLMTREKFTDWTKYTLDNPAE